MDSSSIRGGVPERFRARARASGFKRSDRLWIEAVSQHQRGWLSAPMRLDANGSPPGCKEGEANHAFRPPLLQTDKIHACDDPKYGRVDAFYGDRAPISLPTWGHIGEIRLRVADTERERPFSKTDHESAYKNLPLTPDSARLCLIEFSQSIWRITVRILATYPTFGASAAVLRCDAFSRIAEFRAREIFGFPVFNYFGDLGCLLPSSIERWGYGLSAVSVHTYTLY